MDLILNMWKRKHRPPPLDDIVHRNMHNWIALCMSTHQQINTSTIDSVSKGKHEGGGCGNERSGIVRDHEFVV